MRRAAVAAAVALLAFPGVARAAGKPYFDSRAGAKPSAAASDRARTTRDRARERFGARAVAEIDRITGTARSIQRLDGTLTPPASGDRAGVAMRWIRANHAALGLSSADVGSLELARREVMPGTGAMHLRYEQSVDGIPAFDNELRVSLDPDGRIVNVIGAPLPGVRLDSIVPRLSATDAMAALQRDVGVRRTPAVRSRSPGARRTTTFANGDFARLVVFGAADGPRLAWHLTYEATSLAHYDAVVDATTGAVLFRQNLTKFAVAARVYPNYPGADRDPRRVTVGTQTWDKSDENQPRNVEIGPWLTSGTTLSGPYVHTYSDLNDDNAVDSGEEIGPIGPGDYRWPQTSFTPGACDYSGGSPAPLGTTVDCTWEPADRTSWRQNREANAVQAFYLANIFRQHLAEQQIGFNGFAGDDPVLVETDDGASTGPNSAHVNNANMTTPPDGRSPRMQMYLFKAPFRNMNGGDDAGTVWHEFTHGLSDRLITRSDGSSALSTAQARAMSEGWSDWYALDYLHRPDTGPLEFDDPNVPDVDIGMSTDPKLGVTRTEPIDCEVATSSTRCSNSGYTFGDFGKIDQTGPEPHADGEIWGQTLWDLRRALIGSVGGDPIAGSKLAEQLVTGAMRLSPPEPSFLDERNAILAADQIATGGANRTLIWSVFAHRGMGYHASVSGANDVTPTEDFSMPPNRAPAGTLTPSPAATKVGETVTFTAAFSDPDGDGIPAYDWDFDGNGSVDRTTSQASTTFAYGTAGTFVSAVTARDARAGAGRATATVTVSAAPQTHKPRLSRLPARGRHAKVAFKLTCLTTCKVTASLKAAKTVKRKLRLKSSTVRKLTRSVTGRRTITLSVPRKARQAAKRRHIESLKLTLSVTARTADGKRDSARRTVTIRL